MCQCLRQEGYGRTGTKNSVARNWSWKNASSFMEVSPACTLYYDAFRDIHVIYNWYPIIEKKALVVKNRIADGLCKSPGARGGASMTLCPAGNRRSI